jgi:hypothetical protein
MSSKIKTEFIKRALENFNKRVDDAQTAAIRKLLHFKTGRLENNRTFKTETGNGFEGKAVITHPDYERFLDIKKKARVSENVQHWRKRIRGKQKSYPIHNRIIMGNYNRLAENLMYGFTEEVKESIKRDFDNQTI